MKLFYRRLGKGRPFVILHGLYGASDNWVGLARKLASEYEIFMPDMRNHGQTGHIDEFDYTAMANDVYKWLNECSISKPVIMGHSMGGKVAIELAKLYPDIISALIILDISPVSYKRHTRKGLLNHQHIIQSILSVDIAVHTTRSRVETELFSYLNDKMLSSFLMKNLARKSDGTFYWRLNLQSLADNLDNLLDGVDDISYTCSIPTLFIRAQNSTYINNEDKKIIASIYHNFTFMEIPNAGHWLHISHENDLLSILKAYLLSLFTISNK